MTLHFVVIPARPAAAQRVQARVNAIAPYGSGMHLTRIRMRGYCVDVARRAPPAGSTFLVGARATQARYSSMRTVRLAGDLAARRGFLRPQGDPAAYGVFVTQYAIWTKLEHWTQARFTAEFVARTRQASTSTHKAWTGEIERTLRALAPARWQDVAIVVDAAARAEARLRTGSTRLARIR